MDGYMQGVSMHAHLKPRRLVLVTVKAEAALWILCSFGSLQLLSTMLCHAIASEDCVCSEMHLALHSSVLLDSKSLQVSDQS